MADAPELIAQARTLGEALAANPVVKSYHQAQHAVRSDDSAQKLLKDYQTHLGHVQTLEADQKPVEVADKHKLRDLEQQMARNDALKNLMRYQADYVTLMNQVNRAMDEPLTRLTQSESRA